MRIALNSADLDIKSVTGEMYCHVFLSEGEKVAVRVKRVTDTREGLSQISSLQNTPLSRISNAHKSSQRTATSSLGEESVVTYEIRGNLCFQNSKTLDNTS